MDPQGLVIGASGGVGAALADALSARMPVTRLSRSVDGFDLCDEERVAAAAQRLSGARFTWLLVATGALTLDGRGPERAFRELDPEVMARSYAVNAIGPALVLKHFTPLLARDQRVVVAALSARLGSIADNRLGGWMSYRASKAALNQLWRCGAIEIARKRPQAVVVTLHPGTVETEMSRPYARGRFTHRPEAAARELLGVLDGLTAEESGGSFDYAGRRILG